ncbi:hypothetical protein [Polyangium jinanense]|uniref:Uncharacterized protein n=1 Tax=Polyangium jinanense TaxID=2829994 RepID=A0A9X3X284_9BACT|nr:hypothetical protein [Polyangium jinanense]MDC3955650.1 hypothetical protein [Polyangium jinanense]MDC3982292.1 hypothetical protein [Polyangium jinanense]
MKKLFGLMAAAALATTAGLAMAEEGAQQQPQPQQGAQQPQQGAQQQQGMQQHKQQRGQKMAQAGIGRHQVTGRIVDIDKEKGDLKVETERGQLEFNFPPASLQNYNEGDQVRLEVLIRPAQQQQQQQQRQQGGQQQGGQQQGGQR